MSRLPLLLLLLLLSLLLCGGATGLRCYICNGLDEPECQSNPPESLAADCAVGRQSGPNAPRPVADASVCWTQRQEVKELRLVTRHCGGPASTEDGTDTQPESYERVGSKGTRSSYYKCNKDLCNAAAGLGKSASWSAWLLLVAAGVIATVATQW